MSAIKRQVCLFQIRIQFSLLKIRINYKNTILLQRHINETRKIIPCRYISLRLKRHRNITKSIRQARRLRFSPFIRTLPLIFIFIVLMMILECLTNWYT